MCRFKQIYHSSNDCGMIEHLPPLLPLREPGEMRWQHRIWRPIAGGVQEERGNGVRDGVIRSNAGGGIAVGERTEGMASLEGVSERWERSGEGIYGVHTRGDAASPALPRACGADRLLACQGLALRERWDRAFLAALKLVWSKDSTTNQMAQILAAGCKKGACEQPNTPLL